MQRLSVALKGLAIAGAVFLGGFVPALTIAQPAFAGVSCPPGESAPGGGACCPSGQTHLSSDNRVCCPTNANTDGNSCLFAKYINPAIALLSACVALVVVIAIVYGGIEYITSAGDPQKAAAGKKHITGALIALLAFVLLFAFLQFMVPGGLI